MKQFAKFWTALAGAVGVVIAGGLLDDKTENYVQVIVAAVAAALVYYVPNEQPTP